MPLNICVRQLGHAVVRRDRRAGVVADRWRKDANAHVEPLVAVDDVIAGEAHDRVAAVAAEDDVAGARTT